MTFINAAAHSGTAPADLLAANALLRGLPHAVHADLALRATPRSYRSAQTLFHEGEPASHCLLVACGQVQVLRYDTAGEERMLRTFCPTDLVAEAAMFMPHGLFPMTARALGDAQVWRIPRQALHDGCERHPPLALALLRALSQRLYQRVNEVGWLTNSSAPQRLAAYLVTQCECQGACIELPTSQRHLAGHLGMRAETLNRLLAQWQANGWIHGERRSWKLCRLHHLQQLAAPGVRSF